MPPHFCLLPQHVEALKAKLDSGELGPDVLAEMTSAERHAAFAEIVGDANAGHINASFESKLLLQNQQKGIETWVKSLGDVKPTVKRDLLARVQRMDKVLEPAELDAFLADLAKQRLGFGVTMEEAGRISELAKAAADARAALDAGGDPMEYGHAKIAFSNYVSDLKNGVTKPITVGGVVREGAGVSKALTASLDDSALFSQGWKTLFTHPDIWATNAKQSFVDLVRQFRGKPVIDELQAYIVSRPNALNGRDAKAGLATGNIEEAFPTSLPERLPGPFGKAYKASESAYTAFLYRTRAEVFDRYVALAERGGIDVDDKAQLEAIGKLVNSLTGRGHLGKYEGVADDLNVAFFSVRKLKSDIDFLTAHQGQQGVTPFVRKQAALNLAKVVTGTATILAIADAVHPGSVEWDPRSTDFGKIKIGNTRFGVTGGMGAIATLAATFVTGTRKSATGELLALDGKPGHGSRISQIFKFLRNKLSPVAGVAVDVGISTDFKGDPITAKSEAQRLVIPMIAQNITAQDPNAAPLLVTLIADALGIPTSTYSTKPKKPAAKHAPKRKPPADSAPPPNMPALDPSNTRGTP